MIKEVETEINGVRVIEVERCGLEVKAGRRINYGNNVCLLFQVCEPTQAAYMKMIRLSLIAAGNSNIRYGSKNKQKHPANRATFNLINLIFV